MKFIKDVLSEYHMGKTCKYIVPQNYDKNLHEEELKISKYIFEIYGGIIEMLVELNTDKTMTADCKWNGKFWEIKSTKSEKSVDSAIRKGLKQIRTNPGGIILYFSNSKINRNKLNKEISNRMSKVKGIKSDIDIIVMEKDKVTEILRYK